MFKIKLLGFCSETLTMGSNTSKPNGEAAVHVQKNDLDVGDSSDPRSPTPEIVRTPLQVS